MKFLIEFSQINLIKFRAFIRLCNKTFTKTGIIMTITKNDNIKVAADPFGINEKFQPDYCETKAIEIYKYLIFIEYPLVSSLEFGFKNSTYNKLELRVTKKDQNNNNNLLNQDNNTCQEDILTFRISKEELNKLSELLHTNFQSSEQLTVKATPIPEFMKNTEEVQNYSGFLSIFDKPTNSIKSGILFKPIKKFYKINDYEDIMENDSIFENVVNQNLGNYLFGGLMKTKFFKKFCGLACKNFNKMLNVYNYKEREIEQKCDKNYLIISYLYNSFTLGNLINHSSNLNKTNDNKSDDFNYIYKISINSELLLKMLKNFYNDSNNPDFIGLWSRGLVMKTNFTIQYNFENLENNNNNNFFDDDEKTNEQNENNENEEESLKYMGIKAIIFFENEAEIIEYKNENNEQNNMEKKKFVMNLIKNSIDDNHEELNKSLDLTLDDIGGKDNLRGNDNLLFDEDENENENNEGDYNDISNEDDKSEDEDNNKKKKKKKNEKEKKAKKPRKKNKK